MNRSIERNFERFPHKGDTKALTRIFDRTARDLFSLAQHMVQHSSDAEDLVQGERPEQIARTLNEAPGTVRTQIHRGLIKLRRFLPAGVLLGTLAQPRSLTSLRSAVLEHAQQATAPRAAAPAP
ncbi:MAG: hypothetical protein GY930_18380 [bacterium]|nr:hypothetical protein [bacterium]